MSETPERYGVDGVIDLMNRIQMGKPLNEAEDMHSQWKDLIRIGYTLREADLADALMDIYWALRTKGDVGPSSNCFAKAHNTLLKNGLFEAAREERP